MKTLALNTIVGPGESDNLLECLQTVDAKNFFDEIVICYTYELSKFNEDRSKLDEYLEQINNLTLCNYCWISDRYPYGNFAAARNTCIDNTTSDFIMWLDCDDRIKCSEALFNLKRQVLSSDRDFIMMGYLINEREPGKFSTRFLKERISRNDKNIRWMHPVHEQLDLHTTNKMANIEGLDIEHARKKDPLISIERNLKILDHELKVEPTQHSYLFHANEMLSKYRNTKNEDDLKQALKEMRTCIDFRYANDENLAMMCYTIAEYSLDNLFEAEIYANLALSFSENYAETHCILGEIFMDKKEEDKAIYHYKKAMKKKLNGMSFQSPYYYEEFPSRRLIEIFTKRQEIELALWYSKLVLRHAPHYKDMLNFRNEALSYLTKENEKWLTTA